MERQKIFNKVLKALKGQEWKRSYEIDSAGCDRCLYFGPQGRKCAVGHLISSRYKRRVMKNNNWVPVISLLDKGLLEACYWEHKEFLTSLQNWHDTKMRMRSGKLTKKSVRELNDIAKDWEVTIPNEVVSEFPQVR